MMDSLMMETMLFPYIFLVLQAGFSFREELSIAC
jgi:hypothetical protein